MTGEKGLVVLTGASAGLGLELARLFAQDGWPLLLAARNGDKLKALAAELDAAHHIPVEVCVVDLAAAGGAEQLYEAAGRTGRPVGVLVNNAGLGDYGPFAQADLDKILQILQVNIVALTRLTRLFLPEMVKRDRGCIMNVASTAAFQPGPLMAVYYASKAYVLHFSEALDAELRKKKVRVSAFCPGPTATEFEARAGLGASHLFTGRKVMSARAAAEVGYRGLLRGKRVVVPGLLNKLLALSSRAFPRRWVTRFVQWMQRRRRA